MKKQLLSLIVFLISCQGLQAQIIFDKQYPTAESDIAECLRFTDDGYLISGARLLSVDTNGNELLSIEGTHNRASYVPSDDGFITARYGSGAASVDGHVIRYDSGGGLLWDRLINEGFWRNGVEDVIALDDGMFIYCGRHQDVVGSGAVIRKLCPSGGIVWQEIWNLDAWLNTHAAELFPSYTNLFVTGSAAGGILGFGSERNLTLTKHDLALGDLIWSYVYGADSTQQARDLLEVGAGNLFLPGYSTIGVGRQGLLISLSDVDSAAIENWVKLYPSTVPEQFNALEATPDGGLLILGTREVADSTYTFVKKTDAMGDEEWEYIFTNAGADHRGVEMVHDGGSTYTIAGYYTDGASETENYFLTKFDLANLNDSTAVGLTDLNSPNPPELQLYPNPVKQSLTIDIQSALPIAAHYQARLFDSQGKVAAQFELNSIKTSFDCTGLQAGLYWLELTSEEFRIAQRFVVAK